MANKFLLHLYTQIIIYLLCIVNESNVYVDNITTKR